MDKLTTSTLTSTSTVFTTSKSNRKNNLNLAATPFSKYVTDVKNVSVQYTSKNIPSSSKEKAREYTNFKEAAKKEKGIKIEKKDNVTNITISGVSGIKIGHKTEYNYKMPQNK